MLSLEVRRLEKRLRDLQGLLQRGEDGGRAVMQALLDGPLTFKPIDTRDGRRYQVEGRIATGALLQVSAEADDDYPQFRRPQGDTSIADTLGPSRIPLVFVA